MSNNTTGPGTIAERADRSKAVRNGLILATIGATVSAIGGVGITARTAAARKKSKSARKNLPPASLVGAVSLVDVLVTGAVFGAVGYGATKVFSG